MSDAPSTGWLDRLSALTLGLAACALLAMAGCRPGRSGRAMC